MKIETSVAINIKNKLNITLYIHSIFFVLKHIYIILIKCVKIMFFTLLTLFFSIYFLMFLQKLIETSSNEKNYTQYITIDLTII